MINGPCIIEDDVIIDDFCKIVGPTYIASGGFIGMSSLVRKSMLCIIQRLDSIVTSPELILKAMIELHIRK